MIPLKVISLERSHERRAFMQRQLDDLGLPFRFFNAIDGSKMTATKFGEAVGVKLTPGEIGCGLSHLAGIREIAEGEHEYAAILEDDVFVLPETRKFLDEQYLRSLPPFDVLQLDGNHLDKPRLTLNVGNIGGYQLCALTKCHHIMFAQVYSREAARRIAASISDVTAPIDNMIFQDRRPFGLRVVEVRPSVVSHNDDFASVIGPRLPVEGFFAKLGRETRRFCNWASRWCSFVQAWGLLGILRLRLRGGRRLPPRNGTTRKLADSSEGHKFFVIVGAQRFHIRPIRAESGTTPNVYSAATAERIGRHLTETLGVEATRAAIVATSTERVLEVQAADLRRASVGRPMCQCHADGFF